LRVNVRIVSVADVNEIVSLSMVPSEELVSVAVTLRVVCPKPELPVRASSRFTAKLPLLSVSACTSAGFSVKLTEPALPAIDCSGCAPVGRTRDSRNGLLHT
jgi:hypothetical protein